MRDLIASFPGCRGLSLFFFNDTATTEIYTLSLHDALPICSWAWRGLAIDSTSAPTRARYRRSARSWRSEEHTSELQSLTNLVCRLLLEKKYAAARFRLL